MSEWYRQGQRVDSAPIGDRGLQYGDGLFETVAIRDGRPRLWRLHVERLQSSCERLGLPAPAASELESALSSALAASRLDSKTLTAKLLLTAGAGTRGYRRTPALQVTLNVGLFVPGRFDARAYASGVQVRLCDTRLAIQPKLAGIKSLNRLEQVLARREWAATEPWEGLMLDTEEKLICGTMSNVFLVREKQYLTPRLDRAGVAGIMRRHVLELLAADGVECRETRVSADDLGTADEVFLTNSQLGAVPVARVDDRDLAVGQATRRVQRLLAINGVPECMP